MLVTIALSVSFVDPGMIDLMGYEISEISVPSPYLKDAPGQLVTLYPNRDRDVYFENHKAPAIEIVKEDSITHDRLANVRFQAWYGSNHTSNVPLSDFYWHDRIPTDAARATIFTTGTYSARLNYRILYKANYSTAYQVLASNLLTSSNYSFSLNAIPAQASWVTVIRKLTPTVIPMLPKTNY